MSSISPERPDRSAPEDSPEMTGADRPTGLSWPTVVFGAIALILGALVLGLQTLNLAIDWSFVVPAVIVVLGTVLIVLGVLGLFTRRDDDPA